MTIDACLLLFLENTTVVCNIYPPHLKGWSVVQKRLGTAALKGQMVVIVCVCVCVCVNLVFRSLCVLMPTEGDKRGTSWRAQGAKKETINHHCHVQRRSGSHGWVMGAVKVIRVTCASIATKKKKRMKKKP